MDAPRHCPLFAGVPTPPPSRYAAFIAEGAGAFYLVFGDKKCYSAPPPRVRVRKPMKNIFLFDLFRSRFCLGIFIVVFIASGLLVPKTMTHGYHLLLAGAFMISFALTITCMARNIKERIALARTAQTSLLGIIAAVLGLSALQVCGVAAPVCGATIGAGVVASLFPGFLFHFLSDWSIPIILLSIAAQWTALYFMNCFKRVRHFPQTFGH